MEVIFILSRDPETPGGGVRTFVNNIAGVMLSNGVKVMIVSPLEVENSLYERLPVGKKSGGNTGFLFKLILKTPFIKTAEKSIIYAQRADFLFPFLLFRRKGKKGIHIHGQQYRGVYEKGNVLGWIYTIIERYSLNRADFIFFTDKITMTEYKRRYGNRPFENKQIELVPVGYDHSIFRPMDRAECRRKLNLPLNAKIIVSVGRLNREKRYDILLKAFKKVHEKEKDVILVLVGDGPERKGLEEQASNMGIKDSVIFSGVQPADQVAIYLNAADMFALSSEREGSPNVVKEALACALPVVATKVGDVEDVIADDRLGVLVPARDIDALADAILTALEKEWNRKYIVNYAEQFTWENIAKRILYLYECWN